MQDWRMAGLVSGKVEADDAFTYVPAGDLRERDILLRRHVAQRRDDHAPLEHERFAAGVPTAQHGTHDVRERETLPHVQPGAKSDLGVTDVIVLEVLAELVRGSLECRHSLQHGDRQLEVRDVLDERRRTVRSLQVVRKSLEILRRHRDSRLSGQLEDRPGANRAVEVEMQLGLGKRLKVSGVVHRDSAVCYQPHLSPSPRWTALVGLFKPIARWAGQADRAPGWSGRSRAVPAQADRALGTTRRGGGIAANRPSLWRTRRQPSSWTIRWCGRHSRTRLGSAVSPPRVHQTR